jgi:uncharacterized protein (TIGR00159 family)
MNTLFSGILTALQNVPAAFGWTDALDVLVVGFFIYLLFALLKRTRSFFILDGIVLLALVYAGARFLNFYLTGFLFQYFFTFFIVILVVIFQKELRSFFEWISVSGRLRRRAGGTRTAIDIVHDTVAKAVDYMAKHKVGALIVFPGSQPIDRLLEGGIVLGGKVSVPLLLSIFDSSSPGHDGAVLIEGDRIKRFSTHLPLAENVEGLGNIGTRHRSALGLAERSDAFIVVVSEERGTISVAHMGKLRALEGIGEFEKELRRFLETGSKLTTRSHWYGYITENWKEKALAVAMALFLWFVLVFQPGNVNRDIEIPVEFRFLPREYVVDDVLPRTVTVSLSGRNSDFNMLNPDTVKIVIDSSDLREGWERIKLTDDLVQHPQSLQITKMVPRSIQLHVKRTETQ